MMKRFLALAMLSVLPLAAQAAINLDRTRIIATEGEKSVSLTLNNQSTHLPYLAHAWVEDEAGQKNSAVFMVLPPLQRLEPQARSQVRLVRQPGADALPKDRESLFYFNVREVPPKSDKESVLQVATQSRIKLFYRPSSLANAPDTPWQERLEVTRSGSGMTLHNPTPYYVTLGYAGNPGQKGLAQFAGVMLKPFGSEQVEGTAALHERFNLGYINDFGALMLLEARCTAGERCTLTRSASR